MKKLLAAAVAATMSVSAMADISITGDAKFEYKYKTTDDGTTKTDINTTNTEANLFIRGKNGDTSVFLDIEVNGHGGVAATAATFLQGTPGTLTGQATATAVTGATHPIDVENFYVTTKLGPVGVKAGNYSSSTSGILGEIENGDRATNKFTLDYTVNGIQFYAGNSGRETGNGDTALNNNMFAGVVATVEGWKLQAKKNNENKNSIGVSGQAGPVGVRVEYADAKATHKKDEGWFANFTGKFDNINVGLAAIKMDADGGITEDDSDIFALSNDGAGNANTQLSADMSIDGTTYGAKVGKVGFDTAGTKDIKYYELTASRALASGVTAKVSYLNTKQDSNKEGEFEVDLSVKF
jgi:hypothetical protein